MNACDLANLRNLTGLWRRMGASALELGGGLVLQRSDAWPHRRWLEPDARPDVEQARAAAAVIARDAASVAPLWAADADLLVPALRAAGLSVGFELLAMQRPRELALPADPDDARLVDVTTHAQADLWTRVASESFGYTIDAPVVRRLVGAPGVQLLLARHDDETVGTALLHEDEGAVGVHMMGVLPGQRRRGHARRVMRGLLLRARGGRAPLVTLQASTLGEPLYASLGFERRFAIPHWTRPADDDAGDPASGHADDDTGGLASDPAR